ncbi:homeobox protein ceh-30-like [Ylistrum balloti]|uniref:homeobox protein ceh-30-like n=1 Tax=Ylistrum balloti TaxID=509963 RepID=UPI002905F180|nr:homeobox protein ceh-30-like [Ylistrum balloti]
MATTNNKKMAFSIENLAKSSCTNDTQTGDACVITRNQWNDRYTTDFTAENSWLHKDITNPGHFTTDGYPNPYYLNNRQTSPCMSQARFNSPLSHSGNGLQQFSDDGYSSEISTPSLYGSGKKRNRMDTDDKGCSSPYVMGSSMKRMRISPDIQKPKDMRVSQVHEERLIDSSFESTSTTSDSDEGIGETPRPKKARTAFSDDQIKTLEIKYKSQKYLPAGERSKLAVELGLTNQQVKTWFQNRRMKEKRKQKDDAFHAGMPLPTGGVDISQLQALGIPCPPPYTINNKHQQMMRDDGIPNFSLSTPVIQSPMPRTSQHVPTYSGYHPMSNGHDNSPSYLSSTSSLQDNR